MRQVNPVWLEMPSWLTSPDPGLYRRRK